MASIYRALDASASEIRVLTVQPCVSASKGILQSAFAAFRIDMLECSIQHVSLDAVTPPTYETISYVWGDQTPCRRIKINGVVRLTPLNTELAIRRMTFTDKPRVLWIDALCINQEDVSERETQVALMGRIYSAAQRNLIYLGPPASETAGVHRVIEECRRLIQPIVGDRSITSWVHNHMLEHYAPESKLPFAMQFENLIASPRKYLLKGTRRPFSDYSVFAEGKLLEDLYVKGGALEALILGNKWFRRVWTLQEAVMAKSNECFLGYDSFLLDHLLEVVAWLKVVRDEQLSLGLRFSRGIAAIVTLFDIRYRYMHGASIEPSMLLHISRQRGSSDTRDRVYGMLGLYQNQQDASRKAITPDYTKTAEEVFRDATRMAILDVADGLNVLLQIHKGSDPLEKQPRNLMGEGRQPSWVPRWLDGALEKAPLEHFWTGWQPLPTQPTVPVDRLEDLFPENRPEILTLRGSIIGTVHEVSPIFNFNTYDLANQYLLMQAGFAPTMWGNPGPDDYARKFGLACLESFQIALKFTADFVFDGAFGECSMTTALNHLARTLIADTTLRGLRSDPEYLAAFAIDKHLDDWRTMSDFWEAARRSAHDRRLATTDTAFLILAPETTAPGDVAAPLQGSVYPFILRPVSEGQFIIVEHCYIEGAMPWQASEAIAVKAQDLPIRTFEIR